MQESHPFYDEYLRSHVGYFAQATAVEIARASLPGPLLHLRSLCNALSRSRARLQFARNSLSLEDHDFVPIEDTVAGALSDGVVGLEGALDGFVMLDQPDQADLTRRMSFKVTQLTNQHMRAKQDELIALKSSEWPGQGTYVEFWAVADFWKHYMPYQPRPAIFGRQNVRDYQLTLGGNSKSGPIFTDLIIPVFNGAVEIARVFALRHNLPVDYLPQPMYAPNCMYQ